MFFGFTMTTKYEFIKCSWKSNNFFGADNIENFDLILSNYQFTRNGALMNNRQVSLGQSLEMFENNGPLNKNWNKKGSLN